MDRVKNGERSGTETPPLRIDPKCFQEALRAFFQPIKNDDPRLDFYTVYKREAIEYDLNYIKKYDEDLNTTLIFAGLFSAVSSAFVINIYSQLQPDPNEQSVALLHAILLTLNQSTISDKTPVSLSAQGGPCSEVVTATCLLYASLLLSLLAAFIAMLGKQWLNRYLRHAGKSMIERCGDRQRKCDGLQKWPFHLFIESLPVILQIALLLLACGLCQTMSSINTFVAGVLIALTLLGVLFYIGIVIAGASSYDCPFQTPASVSLRRSWTKIRPHLISAALPVIIALRALGGVVQRRALRIVTHPLHVEIWNRFRSRLKEIRLGSIRVGLRLLLAALNIRGRSPRPPPPAIQGDSRSSISQEIVPWLGPNDLATIRMKNVYDARCVSWVLRNIADPEALDAAIQLSGTIRWFEDGTDTEPPYALIISTFHACFGSNREVYPGSRNRAYYSGRAILWIHTLAVCKSEKFSHSFPLPAIQYTAPASDNDLTHLLDVNMSTSANLLFVQLLRTDEGHTPSHSQWISNVLLHLSWAVHPSLDFHWIHGLRSLMGNTSIPLDAMLSRLLMCCNFLGVPVEEEVLKVQEKSDRFEEIINQVSRAIVSALNTSHPRRTLVKDVLSSLTRVENRPWCWTEMAYKWCAVIWENRQHCEDWRKLLLLSLEIGFRHLDPQQSWIFADLTHTEGHRELIDEVFKSGESEAIADLLCALTVADPPYIPAHPLLDICARHIVDLQDGTAVPFSPRLRHLVIRSVELIGYKRFEEVGAERFFELLNHLHIRVVDMDYPPTWTSILLDAVQSSEGVQHLAIHSWELLVELITFFPRESEDVVRGPPVANSLLETQGWDKLECWMGIVWMTLPLEVDDTGEEFNCPMASLFYRRPGATCKLTQWMKRWCKVRRKDMPKSFERVCEWAHEEALSTCPPHEGAEKPSHLSRPVRSLLSGGNRFRESLPLV